MNFEYYSISRDAGRSLDVIRGNRVQRLGELRAMVPCQVVSAQETKSSDSTDPVEQQDGPDATRSGFWRRVVAWLKRLFVSLRNQLTLATRS